MMAGLDGIQNKIHLVDAMDKDLYDLPPEEEKGIPKVAFSLEQALQGLDEDRAFLTAGGVFTDDCPVLFRLHSFKLPVMTHHGGAFFKYNAL